MPRKKPIISTQEACLRLSLGISGSWEDLGEKTRLRLHNAYGRIIDRSFVILQEYDATLSEICRAMKQIISISPFGSDKLSEDLRSGAIEKADSLLLSHGLPSPLPLSGASFRRFKADWPELRSQRRRAIRVQKCKYYSLPLNSSWERVRQQEMLARPMECNEQSIGIDERVRDLASTFKHFGFHRSYEPEDRELLVSLMKGVGSINGTKGYVYLKQWRLPNGQTWYKIGVTSNPARREVEQNVLPVPAETIACIEFETMEHARSVERAFLQQLSHLRISGASNRELLHLSPTQLSVVIEVLKHLAQ